MQQHAPTPEKKRIARGFALLLAVLVVSIILAMSFGIFSISLKELILTSFIKDSENSFAAADRALECTLYWDHAYPQNEMPYSIFPTSMSAVPPPNPPFPICDGKQLNSVPATGWNTTGSTVATGTTRFLLNFSDGSCSAVLVVKDATTTIITSEGYNTCNPNNARRTQRTIQVTMS